MIMPTYVSIDLKRWFIECYICMPKKAFDYGKTEIYKIIHVDPDINLSYVGHTTNFVQREKNHKYNCEYYGKYYTYANDNNVYGVIRNNGGWKNFKMVFVEKWPCENKREALAREQYWIEILKPKMNTHMAQRSQQQWLEDNKEHKDEYLKKYYKANKSKILEYRKEYGKAYRHNNIETIKERTGRPFKCDCGATVRWDYRSAHCKTQIHIRRLGQL
jgi:hypothetical protein